MSTRPSLFKTLKAGLWPQRQSLSEQMLTIEPRTPLALQLMLTGGVVFVSSAIAVTVFAPMQSASVAAPAIAAAPVVASTPAAVVASVPASAAEAAPAASSAATCSDDVEKLRAERDKLSATVNAAESQLNIERSAEKQLMTQVKALEAEKVKLKEELAVFESLLPADIGAQGISIRRLKPEVVAPNKLNYQLLVMQGGKGDKAFVGSLQMIVSVMQAGKPAQITFNDVKAVNDPNFRLAFKHYQRIDGTLTLPEGVVMKSLQARILENGQLRTQLSVNL